MIDRLLEWLAQAQFMGLGGSVRAMQYALRSQWGYLRGTARPPRGPFTAIGPALGAEPLPAGWRVRFAQAEVELCLLAPDLARVTWQPGRLPVPYAIARESWPPPAIIRANTAAGWELATPELRLALGRDGRLRLWDGAGGLLREELPPERRGDEWAQRAALRPEEQLYGLGEQTGPLNLRGATHRLWNTDPIKSYGPAQDPLYLTIPVYLGLHNQGSYLVFSENSFPARLTFAEQAEAHFEGGALRTYLVPGPPARALARYAELTGRPPLPPRWALGFHQSRFSYDNEADVRGVAAGFTAYDLPLSAIHLDIHYMDGFRVFTVDQGRFPDLAGLARDLTQQGVRLVTILDPGVKRDPDYWLYREGLNEGHFCRAEGGEVAVAPVWPGWCAFPDFTSPATRTWWGDQYPRLLEQGVAGIWHDMNEPAIAGTWGQHTLAGAVRHSLEGRGGDHREAHNLYGLQMARAGYEALCTQRPDQRPFILSRSGWAGLQRYAWTWTGDVQSSWAMLRQTVPTVLGLGLSGMPYAGPDVGGFKGAPPAELFLRWLQLAALLPFFRVHSTIGVPRREPWAFGPATRERIAAVLRLRARLLPYFYTLAWETSRTGWPLVRPLFWPDGVDRELWGVDDAFLLGDALLVAPILEEGARARVMRLPAGRWCHLWSEQCFAGPGLAQLDAPLEEIPILVRGGSVLPLEEQGRLALHLYPTADGAASGSCYADGGDGDGPWRVDHFHLTRQGSRLRLRWEHEGAYAFAYAEVAVHLHGMTAREAQADGTPLPVCSPLILPPFRELALTIAGA
jgi:alpha-glucosidase